ncbi:MAG: hypothetical protein QW046_06315 [Candidatus Micrarchaeaceae archaeon]
MMFLYNTYGNNYNEFDYIDHVACRKRIIVDRIRYIGKESNNLEESTIMGIDEAC